MKIVGTIEARMGSSRLPGKTMIPIYQNRTLLDLVTTRFRRSLAVDDIVVATTVEEKDNPIALWCKEHGVSCYRGPEDDVLDRVVGAASMHNADAIVQMGADSAYLDPSLVDEMVGLFKSGDYDYVANDLQLTYPLGIYAHVVKFELLEKLNRDESLNGMDREDVVRPIFEHVDRYKVLNIDAPEHLKYPELRLTIDYQEDLELARTLYGFFDREDFSTMEIIDLFRDNPELFTTTEKLSQHSLATTSHYSSIEFSVGKG